jgi:hypothetical protein
MEPLAYVELAVTYEESGGMLEMPSIFVPRSLQFKKLWSWAAIAAMLLLGGFGAAISTAFSDSPPTPSAPQQSTSF